MTALGVLAMTLTFLIVWTVSAPRVVSRHPPVAGRPSRDQVRVASGR